MIRMGLVLTILVITINATLLVTGTEGFNDFGAFADLSSALNQYQNVGAQTDISFQDTTAISPAPQVTDFLGYITATATAGVAALKISIALLAGSIGLINQLDPNNLWGLIILGPIAAVQIFFFLFLIITIAGTLLGSVINR